MIQNIALSSENNTPGCILSIDQSKAFDSVRHDYLTEVLEFFGFGPNMIRMVMTACTGRNACIIAEDGNYTRIFNLGIGTAQGDCPSPTLFILCVQVLIFKLEMDPSIRPLPGLPDVTNIEVNNNDIFYLESNRQTNKVEGFADDISSGIEQSPECLATVKLVLEQFCTLSGLKSNADKTCLMPIGGNETVTEEIRGIGFSVVEQIPLLGITIDRELNCLNVVHNLTIQKIFSIVNYWNNFRLSLPGRIAVAKTLLYSQIGYLGCIITPTKEQVKTIERLVFNFVKGPLNIAMNRMCLPVTLGGIGLFDIKDYVTALQATWVKRAAQSSRDCWRADLYTLGAGSPLTINPTEINKPTNPILHNIATSWQNFLTNFSALNGNYLKSRVFNNPLIKCGVTNNRLIDREVLRQNQPINLTAFGKLKVCDFFDNDGFKNLDTLNREYNIGFNHLTHFRLGLILTNFKNNFKPTNTGVRLLSIEVETFLNNFKKGSKPLRKAMELKKSATKKATDIRSVHTYFRLIDMEMEDEPFIQTANKWWDFHALPNNVREFLFKFRNNYLPLNTRVSNFVENIDRSCTFCNLTNIHPVQEETFLHLFFDCNHTQSLMSCFIADILYEFRNMSNDEKKVFFLKEEQPNEIFSNYFILMAKFLFLFLLWDSKTKKRLYSWLTMKNDLFYMLCSMQLYGSYTVIQLSYTGQQSQVKYKIC